jgi:hypothetical protein
MRIRVGFCLGYAVCHNRDTRRLPTNRHCCWVPGRGTGAVKWNWDWRVRIPASVNQNASNLLREIEALMIIAKVHYFDVCLWAFRNLLQKNGSLKLARSEFLPQLFRFQFGVGCALCRCG